MSTAKNIDRLNQKEYRKLRKQVMAMRLVVKQDNLEEVAAGAGLAINTVRSIVMRGRGSKGSIEKLRNYLISVK